MPAPREPVTHPVSAASAVEQAAAVDAHSRATLDGLVPILYDELRDAARRQLAARAGGGTLSATDLVHETYLKLARQNQLAWIDRQHFMALAALAMRHVLMDRAKARLASKREGSGRRITLDEQLIPDAGQPDALLQISEALERLGAEEPRDFSFPSYFENRMRFAIPYQQMTIRCDN